EVREAGYTFPYLYDETQEVARAYRAACTPDFFLFDSDRKLVYRGQLDDSRPNSGKPVTGADLRAALDAVLAGRPVSADQRPSAGCDSERTAGSVPRNCVRLVGSVVGGMMDCRSGLRLPIFCSGRRGKPAEGGCGKEMGSKRACARGR